MAEIKETVRLYDADAYATAFSATVVSCEEVKKKKETLYEVILDQTLFFPEEGGQSPDRGILDEQPVLDVQIRKGVIRHTVRRPITEGRQIDGRIDWNHRFSNMQQHSGEHLFSGLVHKHYGYDNVGFHLSDQIVTMDFNGVLTLDQALEIEMEVNRAITENFESVITFPSKDELKKLEYRSKIEIEGQVRIVTYPGYDVCACCAPHVKRTGEIGMLKLMSLQNYKGGVRISILCGFRALEAFREKSRVISELMGVLTTGQDQLVEQVGKMKAANQAMSTQLWKIRQEMLAQKLSEVPAEQTDVFLFEPEIETTVMRNAVNTLTEQHPGLCGLFSGDDENGYSFIIGSRTADCRETAALLRTKLAARGGGSAQMVQGSVKAGKTAILEVLEGPKTENQ